MKYYNLVFINHSDKEKNYLLSRLIAVKYEVCERYYILYQIGD